jgi:hypothetical protein
MSILKKNSKRSGINENSSLLYVGVGSIKPHSQSKLIMKRKTIKRKTKKVVKNHE